MSQRNVTKPHAWFVLNEIIRDRDELWLVGLCLAALLQKAVRPLSVAERHELWLTFHERPPLSEKAQDFILAILRQESAPWERPKAAGQNGTRAATGAGTTAGPG